MKERTWDWKNNHCKSVANSCEEEPGTGRTITVGQWLIVVKERYWDWKNNHCRSMVVKEITWDWKNNRCRSMDNSCEGKNLGQEEQSL